MNETIKEWIAKADGDFGVADRELNDADEPYFDAVCFHSQQCIEKLMKAVLINAAIVPPRTHDLVVLGKMVREALPDWEWPVEELRFLSHSSISFRYPGESADVDDARKAFEICSRIREKLLPHIK